MKDAIKKISAFAMAFTLLGTGTAISNTISPKFDNSITVNAAFNSYNGTVKTQGSNLNVRSGPGTNYKIIRKLSNGSRVTIYEENNGWGRISGSQEWVSLSYIAPDSTPAPTPTPTPTPTPIVTNDVTQIFSDVYSGQWYVSAVQYVYDKGLMSGKGTPQGASKPIFDPSGIITKGEFSTILYKLAGLPEIHYYSIFNDVADNQWYTKPVLFSYYYGIIPCVPNTNYGVSDVLTREKCALMLYNYVKVFGLDSSKTDGASSGFNDSGSISAEAKDAMDWAVSKGVMKGKGNNILDPQGKITRAECAQVIKNYFEGPSSSSNRIVERADYLYNIEWVCQKNVDGWRRNASNKFLQGNTYHIPYGQPAHEGKYVYYGVSIEKFIEATKNPNSDFYTKRSLCYEYDGNNRININKSDNKNSVYYAMDCSAFASYCWGLTSKKTTSTWGTIPNQTCIGDVTATNLSNIMPGDVLNYAGSHIVVVTDVNRDNKTFEITEMTVPQMKRSTLNETDMIKKYGQKKKNGTYQYKIYRLNDMSSVPAPTNN